MDWQFTFDVSDVWDKAPKHYTPSAFAGLIAKRIRESKFYQEERRVLVNIVNKLQNAADFESLSTFDDFDEIWDDFYNYADKNKIWVKTF